MYSEENSWNFMRIDLEVDEINYILHDVYDKDGKATGIQRLVILVCNCIAMK